MDVTEATFQSEVLDRSGTTPVVVDFWAPWCQPCRVIGPVLDRVVGATDGDVVLAKVNVDENPRLSQAFGIQGIPAVKVFKDGRVADEMTGVPPQVEQAVQALVARVMPSEADRLAAAATEDGYRAALALEPSHAVAAPGLAEILAGRGEDAQALELLKRLPETSDVAKLRASIELRDSGAADAGDYAAALERYLAQVRATKDDAAREAMVRIFTALGDDDPLVREYRPKLAGALF